MKKVKTAKLKKVIKEQSITEKHEHLIEGNKTFMLYPALLELEARIKELEGKTCNCTPKYLDKDPVRIPENGC